MCCVLDFLYRLITLPIKVAFWVVFILFVCLCC